MKKLITSLCAFALTFSVANAQDYTPKSGDWSIGTDAGSVLTYVGNLFNGTADSPEVAFSNGMYVSGKMFTDDNTAWRANFNLGMSNNSSTLSDGVDSTDDIDETSSSFDFTAGIGKEFRRGSNRLQGYYGYGALVGFGSSDSESPYEGFTGTQTINESNFMFGGEGFIGVEYFVKPKMSLGAEYSHNVTFTSSSTTTDINFDDENFTDISSEIDNSSFNIAGSTTSIRMNFYF